MAEKYKNLYQFKIALNDIEPAIWRRIQVPESYSFWDLHVAIQDAMGWEDCHLHEFVIANPLTGSKDRIGISDDDDIGYGVKVLPGWEIKIKDYFSGATKKADYLYDFGDSWEHLVVLEKIVPKESGQRYPLCLEGARACPPEDCGGVPGYYRFVEIMEDSKHEEYQEMVEWYGRRYKPEAFNTKIAFTSPSRRLTKLFEED